MKYYISRNASTSQFIQVQLDLHCNSDEVTKLQLAAWRPGRYDLANYAQKIRGFKIVFENEEIIWRKTSKDLWEFKANHEGNYRIYYEFYANQMDAGGSWSDDQQLYLNFSNFAFDIKGREVEPIQIDLSVPQHYKFATALSYTGDTFSAASYQHLIDSPIVASEHLKHFSYQVNTITFHVWIQGEIHFDIDYLIDVFMKFTEKQIEGFKEFPVKEYHFIYQLLPYAHFHGVEHKFSTVITYGPAENLNEKSNLDKLVGVSSHELYHFWNVCRIRPEELLPYDLSKEILLDTGLVLEGVTTYMGDLYLLKSGYYTLEEYLSVLEKLFFKEFGSKGWQNQSIVESSLDLWLDGYNIGIPDKKVSIYNRGALISLCLDLMLLNQKSSLQHIMTEMWFDYAKKGIGYSLSDFESKIISKFSKDYIIKLFFSSFVYGHKDILPTLQELLFDIGIGMEETFTGSRMAHHFGIQTDETGTVTRIHADSKAYFKMMLGDQIVSVDTDNNYEDLTDNQSLIKLNIKRWGRELQIVLEQERQLFFPEYKLSLISPNKKRERWISGHIEATS